MMMPSIFGENLFDDFMNDFSFPTFPNVDKELYGKHAKNLMKTDVKETENAYEIDIDLPGFKKDEIQMELKDGVLTVSAAKGLDKDEEDKKGNYIRKERYAGSMSRSFYVGKHVTVEDVHPKYENGILSFSVPKEEAKPVEEKFFSSPAVTSIHSFESLEFNPFTKISKEWMLVTAGDEKKSNTMTASWGGVGIMWGKNIATAYIRPQRYTKKFMDETGMYTLSFLSEDYRKALSVCGSVSGKDVEDKWKEAGLHPYAVDGTTAVEEADLIFVCKTQYTQDMKPECFDVKENDEKWYPDKDYHTMYMGEIVKVLKRV